VCDCITYAPSLFSRRVCLSGNPVSTRLLPRESHRFHKFPNLFPSRSLKGKWAQESLGIDYKDCGGFLILLDEEFSYFLYYLVFSLITYQKRVNQINVACSKTKLKYRVPIQLLDQFYYKAITDLLQMQIPLVLLSLSLPPFHYHLFLIYFIRTFHISWINGLISQFFIILNIWFSKMCIWLL